MTESNKKDDRPKRDPSRETVIRRTAITECEARNALNGQPIYELIIPDWACEVPTEWQLEMAYATDDYGEPVDPPLCFYPVGGELINPQRGDLLRASEDAPRGGYVERLLEAMVEHGYVRWYDPAKDYEQGAAEHSRRDAGGTSEDDKAGPSAA